MTHVTCRLTAKNWDQLRNPTLGSQVRATFNCNQFMLNIAADWHIIVELRNKSVFSLLCMLTTWHCPHSPTAAAERQPCSSRSMSPARRAHSSKPAAAGLPLWAHAGTDRRTDTTLLHRPAPHTMQATMPTIMSCLLNYQTLSTISCGKLP